MFGAEVMSEVRLPYLFNRTSLGRFAKRLTVSLQIKLSRVY